MPPVRPAPNLVRSPGRGEAPASGPGRGCRQAPGRSPAPPGAGSDSRHVPPQSGPGPTGWDRKNSKRSREPRFTVPTIEQLVRKGRDPLPQGVHAGVEGRVSAVRGLHCVFTRRPRSPTRLCARSPALASSGHRGHRLTSRRGPQPPGALHDRARAAVVKDLPGVRYKIIHGIARHLRASRTAAGPQPPRRQEGVRGCMLPVKVLPRAAAPVATRSTGRCRRAHDCQQGPVNGSRRPPPSASSTTLGIGLPARNRHRSGTTPQARDRQRQAPASRSKPVSAGGATHPLAGRLRPSASARRDHGKLANNELLDASNGAAAAAPAKEDPQDG